ncbi:hypothetical protein [Anditalea andensis]|uniref:Uncharacterized protein n=1 Tax=Anditalea andensis TaxID=1048983 RepID=A0A074L099_9BACT|nr:hypothetical protein [Anditalea andensis]KEO74584.1 hypothetical protein EL17_02600 [Anditalea andensis]
MKTLTTTILLLAIYSSAFAFPPADRIFLIIFDKEELKSLKSSPEYIELTFNKVFNTKTYSGNSEAAMLLTVTNTDLDRCDIGQMLVQVNRHTSMKLQEVAFRIVDMTESKLNYNSILANLDAKPVKKKVRSGISLQAN